jgi:hypothetical protein
MGKEAKRKAQSAKASNIKHQTSTSTIRGAIARSAERGERMEHPRPKRVRNSVRFARLLDRNQVTSEPHATSQCRMQYAVCFIHSSTRHSFMYKPRRHLHAACGIADCRHRHLQCVQCAVHTVAQYLRFCFLGLGSLDQFWFWCPDLAHADSRCHI